MAPDRLTFHAAPDLHDTRMILGFSGWMDGGDVSTGTVKCLADKLHAKPLAEIDPEGFYLLNFPGSMEISALFRPHTKIEGGLIGEYRNPTNAFFYSEENNLIAFVGREPNFHWTRYAECIFQVASQFQVSRIYFIGSVAGAVPHTREPRLSCSVSAEPLKETMQQYGVRFSDYEGPASLCTYLTVLAPKRGCEMVNLVAEIPAYVQGRNLRCIESVTRRLAGILGLRVDLDDLRALSDRLEEKLNEAMEKRPELAERIHELEADYDNEVFDTQMDDLKDWLQQQGIRLD